MPKNFKLGERELQLLSEGVGSEKGRRVEVAKRLAEATGRTDIDSSYLNKLLRGGVQPSPELLEALLMVLGLDREKFYAILLDTDSSSHYFNALRLSADFLPERTDQLRELLSRIEPRDVRLMEELIVEAAAPFSGWRMRSKELTPLANMAHKSINAWLKKWLDNLEDGSEKSEYSTIGRLNLILLRKSFDAALDELKRIPHSPLYTTYAAYPEALRECIEELLGKSGNSKITLLGTSMMLPSAWFNFPDGFHLENRPYYVGTENPNLRDYREVVEGLCDDYREEADPRVEYKRLIVHDSDGAKRQMPHLLQPNQRMEMQKSCYFAVPRRALTTDGKLSGRIRPPSDVEYRRLYKTIAEIAPKLLKFSENDIGAGDNIPATSDGTRYLIVHVEDTAQLKLFDNTDVGFVSLVDHYCSTMHTDPKDAKTFIFDCCDEKDTVSQSSSIFSSQEYLEHFGHLFDLLIFGVRQENKVSWKFAFAGSFHAEDNSLLLQCITDPSEIAAMGEFWHCKFQTRDAKSLYKGN